MGKNNGKHVLFSCRFFPFEILKLIPIPMGYHNLFHTISRFEFGGAGGTTFQLYVGLMSTPD
jgi:hypothetical protein